MTKQRVNVIRCISKFQGYFISRKAVVVEPNGPKFGPQRYLVLAEYFWLLRVQGQFGVIRCISSFWRPCIYFWLKYSGIFVLRSLYITGILLTSKWPSRGSMSLGLLFQFPGVQCWQEDVSGGHASQGSSVLVRCQCITALSYPGPRGQPTPVVWSQGLSTRPDSGAPNIHHTDA